MSTPSSRSERDGVPPRGAQRRYLTVLFSDLSHSVRLVAAMEAEDYADLIAGVRAVYEDVIPKHGGTIMQIVGDGLLASFGYPEAREDDGRRATEAALELHEIVRGLQFDFIVPGMKALQLHTGIHTGLVLIGQGDAVSGRMRLFGNAVNIAARLSDAAAAGQILVSEETLGTDRHFFHADSGLALNLQGIDEPIAVCRITGRAPVRRRYEARTKRGLTPFVGRQAELQTLMQELSKAIAGTVGLVAVAAPAGLGKTRLAEEFLSRAADRDCKILRGYCESYLSAEPMQPFLQMLRFLCGLNDGISAAIASESLQQTLEDIDLALGSYHSILLRALSLGGTTASASEPVATEPETAVTAMCRLFEVLALKTPLALFIDDWQWADDATRQLLGKIGGLEGRSIFVLVSTREAAPGDVGIGDALLITLRPFNGHETEQAIARLLPDTDKFLAEKIRDHSGGNPLYVEELCHSAAHEGATQRDRHAPIGEAWLDKLIEARVKRLSPEQVDLVHTAAVVGNVIPVRVLESVTGYRADHPLVTSLADQDLIYPGERDGILRFKHGIARDVIYNSVGLHRRKVLHWKIAQAFSQQITKGHEEELYEPLAYHYAASGEAELAAHFAELAGDKAMAASALDRAQVQYRAALDALDLTVPSEGTYQRWLSIAQRLALACVFDPSREQLDVLKRAFDLAASREDSLGMAHAEYWVGYINYALGKSDHAIRHLEGALGRGPLANAEPLVRQIRATLGQAYAAACDYDKALALLDEAIAGRRRRRRSNRPAVGFAYTLACKGSVLGDRGRFEDAYQCFDEALAAVYGAGHEVEGSILCWRSGVALWQGRWDEASQCARNAQRVAERVKSLYLHSMSLSLGGYASWKMHDTDAFLQTIVDATSWLENRDRGLFISLNYGWLTEGMASRKQWKAARRYAARALARARRDDRIGEAMVYRALARASAAGHARMPSEFYLARTMDSARARESPHEVALTQLCEAEIKLARGQRAQAEPLLDKAEAAFAAMAMTWHLDAVQRLRRES